MGTFVFAILLFAGLLLGSKDPSNPCAVAFIISAGLSTIGIGIKEGCQKIKKAYEFIGEVISANGFEEGQEWMKEHFRNKVKKD